MELRDLKQSLQLFSSIFIRFRCNSETAKLLTDNKTIPCIIINEAVPTGVVEQVERNIITVIYMYNKVDGKFYLLNTRDLGGI